MTQIIALSGSKGSGKSTIANFLHGYILKLNEVIREFEITPDGELKVNTHYIKDGEVKEDMGILDLMNNSDGFIQYADRNIWPFIKLYHFADPLKEICCGLLGLEYDQVYGHSKNSMTKLRWQDMPGSKKKGNMTAREVMQYVGTEIFRKMYKDVWTNALVTRINEEKPLIAVVADCRFDNEASAIKQAGGILIRLNRKPDDDSHESENGFVDTVFDLEVPDVGVTESCDIIIKYLFALGINEFLNKAE